MAKKSNKKQPVAPATATATVAASSQAEPVSSDEAEPTSEAEPFTPAVIVGHEPLDPTKEGVLRHLDGTKNILATKLGAVAAKIEAVGPKLGSLAPVCTKIAKSLSHGQEVLGTRTTTQFAYQGLWLAQHNPLTQPIIDAAARVRSAVSKKPRQSQAHV